MNKNKTLDFDSKLSKKCSKQTHNSFRRSVSKIDCMLASVFERERHLDRKFNFRVLKLKENIKLKQWIQNSQKVITVLVYKS